MATVLILPPDLPEGNVPKVVQKFIGLFLLITVVGYLTLQALF